MTIFLAILLLYVLPAILVYFWIRTLYSEKGKHSDLSVDGFDVFITICPGINLIWGLECWVVFWPYQKPLFKIKPINWNKFFGIKK